MLGGITPGPAPREPIGFDSNDPGPIPRPIPPVIGRGPTAVEVMPPVIGERLNEGLEALIPADERGRNESEEPPPIRPGMNPSVLPP
jgi:hypothetical protein